MRPNTRSLPLTRSLSPARALALIAALLMTAASLAGLLFPAGLYPAEALRRAFLSNDVVNLFIGLPILLGSMWAAHRGRLLGLLFWPGALFYVLYNYIAYAVAMPLTAPFVVYLALVALSAFGVFGLITSLDTPAVQRQLAGAVPERLAGVVLAGLGALFFLRAAGQVLAAPAGPELGVLVADLLTTPVWVIGGVLLWRRQALGYAAGLGLLFQGSMLFVALLVFFILQPFLTATPFPLTDFVVILVMGLVCFVPFGLFVRGVLKGAPIDRLGQ
jgi:hypothetical protein